MLLRAFSNIVIIVVAVLLFLLSISHAAAGPKIIDIEFHVPESCELALGTTTGEALKRFYDKVSNRIIENQEAVILNKYLVSKQVTMLIALAGIKPKVFLNPENDSKKSSEVFLSVAELVKAMLQNTDDESKRVEIVSHFKNIEMAAKMTGERIAHQGFLHGMRWLYTKIAKVNNSFSTIFDLTFDPELRASIAFIIGRIDANSETIAPMYVEGISKKDHDDLSRIESVYYLQWSSFKRRGKFLARLHYPSLSHLVVYTAILGNGIENNLEFDGSIDQEKLDKLLKYFVPILSSMESDRAVVDDEILLMIYKEILAAEDTGASFRQLRNSLKWYYLKRGIPGSYLEQFYLRMTDPQLRDLLGSILGREVEQDFPLTSALNDTAEQRKQKFWLEQWLSRSAENRPNANDTRNARIWTQQIDATLELVRAIENTGRPIRKQIDLLSNDVPSVIEFLSAHIDYVRADLSQEEIIEWLKRLKKLETSDLPAKNVKSLSEQFRSKINELGVVTLLAVDATWSNDISAEILFDERPRSEVQAYVISSAFLHHPKIQQDSKRMQLLSEFASKQNIWKHIVKDAESGNQSAAIFLHAFNPRLGNKDTKTNAYRAYAMGNEFALKYLKAPAASVKSPTKPAAKTTSSSPNFDQPVTNSKPTERDLLKNAVALRDEVKVLDAINLHYFKRGFSNDDLEDILSLRWADENMFHIIVKKAVLEQCLKLMRSDNPVVAYNALRIVQNKLASNRIHEDRQLLSIANAIIQEITDDGRYKASIRKNFRDLFKNTIELFADYFSEETLQKYQEALSLILKDLNYLDVEDIGELMTVFAELEDENTLNTFFSTVLDALQPKTEDFDLAVDKQELPSFAKADFYHRLYLKWENMSGGVARAALGALLLNIPGFQHDHIILATSLFGRSLRIKNLPIRNIIHSAVANSGTKMQDFTKKFNEKSTYRPAFANYAISPNTIVDETIEAAQLKYLAAQPETDHEDRLKVLKSATDFGAMVLIMNDQIKNKRLTIDVSANTKLGWDIVSFDVIRNQVYLIEVKGSKFDKPLVHISQGQLNAARKFQEHFLLAVCTNLNRSDLARINYFHKLDFEFVQPSNQHRDEYRMGVSWPTLLDYRRK